MQKSKFAQIIDNIAVAFIIMLFSYVWLKKITKSFLVSITLSLISTFFIIKLIYRNQNQKLKKLKIEKEELNLVKEYNFSLRTKSKQKQLDFIKKLLPQLSFKQVRYLLINDKFIVTTCLDKDDFKPEDLFEIYNKIQSLKQKNKTLFIFCNNQINNQIFDIIKKITDIKIEIISPLETFSLMKKNNIYPEIINKKTQNNIYFVKINTIFMQKSAKLFFKCGFILLVTSLFIPYFSYYIITGSILVFIAIICFYFGKKENKTPNIFEKFALKNDL